MMTFSLLSGNESGTRKPCDRLYLESPGADCLFAALIRHEVFSLA
jgi:hypothetical protein